MAASSSCAGRRSAGGRTTPTRRSSPGSTTRTPSAPRRPGWPRPRTAISPGCGSSSAGGSARPEGETLRAVRAVDTATHPDHQGKGIFTKLTLGAIPDLDDDGVDLIFNTPNDKSRPGYLKMGWSEVGRVPVGRAPRLAQRRSRGCCGPGPPPSCGPDRAEHRRAGSGRARRTRAASSGCSTACRVPQRIATDRTVAYLQWRYRFPPLRYRAVLVGRTIEEGLVILRLRGRGPGTRGGGLRGAGARCGPGPARGAAHRRARPPPTTCCAVAVRRWSATASSPRPSSDRS